MKTNDFLTNQKLERLANEVARLEAKIINIEYQLSRMRSYVPEMQRLNIHSFKVVNNDEAEKFHKGVVDRDTEFRTSTKGNHERCHECNPGWDERLKD